jgi:NAD(P)-dependent dehydrogenase (short-subunit alcohol dehydrogenase family)
MSKRWFITGGTRGIGLATARRAVATGDRVAVVARRLDTAAQQTLGDGALVLEGDVASPTSIAQCVAQVAQSWGGIDVLVNNAGLHRGGGVESLPEADWNAVLATNLSGPLHCVRAVLKHMPGGGSIVNVGAVVGLRGFNGDSAYGASKAGLVGLTQVLAVELARRSVRVNLVVPGFVDTAMTSEVDDRARERLLRRVPMRRTGTEDEIAEVIWWVAGSTYMTGSIVATDGGMLAQL